MNIKRNHRALPAYWILLGLIIASLSGCRANQPAATPKMNMLPSSTFNIPTNTGVTLPATSTRTPTFTSTVTKTPSPVPTHTWTPLPTLEPTQAAKLVLDLLTNNAGCELPCWWGFYPGSTSWLDARRLLDRIAVEITSTAPNTNPITWGVKVPSETNELDIGLHDQIYTVQNGIIKDIKLEIINLYPYTDFSAMIKKQGQPAEIWINTGENLFGKSTTNAFVALYYPEKSVFILYENQEAQENGREISICPQDNLGDYMLLWDPRVNYSFRTIMGNHFFGYPTQWKLLEEATDTNTEIYYHEVLDNATSGCLKTPLDRWSLEAVP